MSDQPKHDEVQGLMVLLASFSHGLEETIGRGAKSVVFRAGKGVGAKCEAKEKTEDPIKAIELVEQELGRKGVACEVVPWKPASESSYVYEKGDGRLALKVVCRNCVIRCALFRYSHEQQQSLCNLNQGEFCGIFQKITGKTASLDIIHAGENACLKELTWTK